MKKIIKILIVLSLVATSTGVAFAQSASDLANSSLQDAINQAYGGGSDVELKPTSFVDALVGVVNTLLTFTGVIFFLLMIYGGWLWLTARGSEEQIEKAKKILREATIGLVVIILARLLTEVVLYQLEQATNIPNQETINEGA